MNEINPYYKKLSWRITREGSKYPFRNDYTYKFSTHQFLEQIDDLSSMSSYTYNEIKQITIDQLTNEFRIALNSVVFGDPAGKDYIEAIEKKFMNEIYQQIKSECELPIALFSYTYRDFDGVLHWGSIEISFKDNDETNIEKMEKIKSKYGEFFMFFNNSTEGKEFWKNNPITITPKQ